MPDGRGMAKAMAWMYPFIADKKKWPQTAGRDVRQRVAGAPALPGVRGRGAGQAGIHRAVAKKLDADPTVEEVLRNFPVRQPLLWI